MEPERITEYAVRVTLPGHVARLTPCANFVEDAIRAYDHAASLHGEAAVEFLARQVTRTEWVPGKLPPKVDPEPPDSRTVGDCEPSWVQAAADLGKDRITDVPTRGML